MPSAGLHLRRRRRRDRVRERIPVDCGVVDDGRGNRLRHDAVHDLRDEALLREAVLRRVVRLDLVAEVPVREELQALRPEARPLRVHDVVHPDVVLGDVELGVRRGLREPLRDVRRHARLKAAREARLGPLQPRPRAALFDPLLERGKREVQKRDERDLLREEVLADVGGGLPRAEEPVYGEDRPHLDHGPPREVAADLGHVPVQRLEVLLEAHEEAVQQLRIGREVLLRERREGRSVAVGGAPEGRGLVHAALDARALSLAVGLKKVRFRLRDGGCREDGGEQGGSDHPRILSEERLPRDRMAVREHAHDVGPHEEDVDEAAAEMRERNLVRDAVHETAVREEVLVAPRGERPLLLNVHEANRRLPFREGRDPAKPNSELPHLEDDARPAPQRLGPLDHPELFPPGRQEREDRGIAVEIPDCALRHAGQIEGKFERRHLTFAFSDAVIFAFRRIAPPPFISPPSSGPAGRASGPHNRI
jgi:hypothetical protein